MNFKHHASHFLIVFMAAVLSSLITLHFAEKSFEARGGQGPYFTSSPSRVLYSDKANVVNAVKNLGPAVVNINTETVQRPVIPPGGFDRFFRNFLGEDPFAPFNRPFRTEGAGSGVILDAAGLVVTNEHVIHNATTITVSLTDNRRFEAKVVGTDPQSDVAVLRIQAPPRDLPTAKLGDSDHLQIGEWVVAIGNPYGFRNTVTVGVLSAAGRSIAGEEHQYQDLLQTDAAINPGNSGGPLADLSGTVIGINTAIIPFAQGIGFAIPINIVKRVVSELMASGHVRWPFLGVNMDSLNPRVAKYLKAPSTEGVLVLKTVPNSPAEKGGIERGDVIVEIAGKKVGNPDELARTVRRHRVGEKVRVRFYRLGKLREVDVLLAERPR